MHIQQIDQSLIDDLSKSICIARDFAIEFSDEKTMKDWENIRETEYYENHL